MAAISSRYVSEIPKNLPRSVGTAVRLTELERLLVPKRLENRRAEVIEGYTSRVASLWKECLKTPTSDTLLDSAEEFLDSAGKIGRLYQVEDQTSKEEILRCARLMVKDSSSLLVTPVKKSPVGVEGPILLVNYPREIKGENKTKAYVVKWADKNEVCTGRFYEEISTFFQDKEMGVGFLVPPSTAFDFATATKELPGWQFSSLTDKETQLEENFEKLFSEEFLLKEGNPEDQRVLVSSRILGESLWDFPYTKYRFLTTEQKTELFTRLARLAFLDLLVGNKDRFLRLEEMTETFSFAAFGANLGNVMLVWHPGEENLAPVVYAIDNTMDRKLVESLEAREKYKTFLRELFLNPSFMVSQLVDHMRQNMKASVPDHLNGEEARKAAKAHLVYFNHDLESLAPAAFQEGIKDMIYYLQKDRGLISQWNGEKGASIRAYLQAQYPELLASLQERLDLFQLYKK